MSEMYCMGMFVIFRNILCRYLIEEAIFGMDNGQALALFVHLTFLLDLKSR